MKLTVKVLLLEEESLKLWNQVIEKLKMICKMQNVSNTGQDSQTNPREINVTKSFDNGKVLTLDHRSMSDEPLPRNQFGQDQSKNR